MIDPLAHPARDANGAALTLAWRRVIGPGFALPRDAGRRPALQAVPALFLGWGTRFRRPLGGDAGGERPHREDWPAFPFGRRPSYLALAPSALVADQVVAGLADVLEAVLGDDVVPVGEAPGQGLFQFPALGHVVLPAVPGPGEIAVLPVLIGEFVGRLVLVVPVRGTRRLGEPRRLELRRDEEVAVLRGTG